MTLLTNSSEGGTNGTTITTANSGGASGNAYDGVTIGTGATVAYDNAHAAHGTLAAKIATGSTSAQAFVGWTTSMGTQSQVWAREYLYFTANPSTAIVVFRTVSAGTQAGGFRITTTGKVAVVNGAGTNILTSATSIPLNTWFRLEGFIIGSATVGQLEVKIFTTPDSSSPVETLTTAATQNTTGSMDTYEFGCGTSVANVVAFWEDDLGLSSTGYLGPSQVFPPPAFLTVVKTPKFTRRPVRAFVPVTGRPPRSISLTRAIRAIALKPRARPSFVPAIRLQPLAGALVRAVRGPPQVRKQRAFANVIKPPATAQVYVLSPVKAVRPLSGVRKRTLYLGPLTPGATPGPPNPWPPRVVTAAGQRRMPRPRAQVIRGQPILASVAPIQAPWIRANAARPQVRRKTAFLSALFVPIVVPSFISAPHLRPQVRKVRAFGQSLFVQPLVPVFTVAARPSRQIARPRRPFAFVVFISQTQVVVVPGFTRARGPLALRRQNRRTAFIFALFVAHLPACVAISATLADTVTISAISASVTVSAVLVDSLGVPGSSASVTVTSIPVGNVQVSSKMCGP